MIKVLVVDDSALVRKLFGSLLSGESEFDVRFARDGVEALDQLKLFQPDVITLDVQMPHMDGLACLNRIMIERPTPVVMVSSMTTAGAEVTLEALRLGAIDFVAKPEGAVSLHMKEFGPKLVAKLRAAAAVKPKASLRLRERVRHRIGGRWPEGAAVTGAALTGPDRPAAGQRAAGTGIVLVGVSTGGPTALEALLTPLPADFAWPIVIAQHMPATFTGPLSSRLDKVCALHVSEVTKPVVLERGCAYIGRGDGDVIVSRRGATLFASAVPAGDHPWHPSTDRLVRSALRHLLPGQIVGILLTGMGDDGAQAMSDLHRLGGRTVAEAAETAVVWGMPGALASLKGADWILPVDRIAQKLQQLVPLHASDPKRPQKESR